MARISLRNQVAIVGVGSTDYGRNLNRTQLSLALEAAITAIQDAGVHKNEIDGICGSGTDVMAVGEAGFLSLQGALGIEETTWVLNSHLGSCFVYAVAAIQAGLCDTALIVQSYLRGLNMSRSAANDPYRARAAASAPTRKHSSDLAERWYHSGEPYAAWMGRYMFEFNAPKETFGWIALNNRSYATRNRAAVMQTPLTMDDYLQSREIWSPMQMLDMDLPVDCAEAMVLTTAERAQDLPGEAVYVHAASLIGTRVGEHYENGVGWSRLAQWAAFRGLFARSDLGPTDMDIFFPWDGYTIDAVGFIEAAGYCGAGEATDLFNSSWDRDEEVLIFNGRTRLSTDGGSLSLGRSGGFSFYSECVRQLRGSCADRQIFGARNALIGIGSFYHDPAAVILTSDRA